MKQITTNIRTLFASGLLVLGMGFLQTGSADGPTAWEVILYQSLPGQAAWIRESVVVSDATDIGDALQYCESVMLPTVREGTDDLLWCQAEPMF